MLRLFALLAVLVIAGCGTVPMFVDLGEGHIIRGSASGRMGSTAQFSATDSRSTVRCTGEFPFNTSRVVSGTITCNNGQSGTYIMNVEPGPLWRGEGQFENGKTFRIFVNYSTDPDKR